MLIQIQGVYLSLRRNLSNTIRHMEQIRPIVVVAML